MHPHIILIDPEPEQVLRVAAALRGVYIFTFCTKFISQVPDYNCLEDVPYVVRPLWLGPNQPTLALGMRSYVERVLADVERTEVARREALKATFFGIMQMQDPKTVAMMLSAIDEQEKRLTPQKLRCPECSQLLRYFENVQTKLRSAVHCPDCGYQMPESEVNAAIVEAAR